MGLIVHGLNAKYFLIYGTLEYNAKLDPFSEVMSLFSSYLKSEDELVQPVLKRHGGDVQNGLIPWRDRIVDPDGCQDLLFANLTFGITYQGNAERLPRDAKMSID